MYNVTFDYSWWYVCQVKTSYGSWNSSVMVSVYGPPGPCAGLYADPAGIQAYQVSLQWMKGAEHNSGNAGRILSYVIEARDNYTSVFYTLATSASPGTPRALICIYLLLYYITRYSYCMQTSPSRCRPAGRPTTASATIRSRT